MALTEGEITAVVAGIFLIGTKAFDVIQARFGTRVSAAVNREQALYDRIESLETRLDHKDEDCEKRIDEMDKKVELNRKVITELRSENDGLRAELRKLNFKVEDVKHDMDHPPADIIGGH